MFAEGCLTATVAMSSLRDLHNQLEFLVAPYPGTD